MSILSRFKDIMSANINAMLDKMEDPSKMIDQILRNLNDDLAKVKEETAGVMAEEKRARRELDDCAAEIAQMQSFAEKAVLSGNDEDAKRFLSKKASLTEKQAALQQGYDLASGNALKMRQMHDKLVEQIADLNNRRDAVKAKVAVAKTQERINKMGDSFGAAQEGMGAFDRMEEKANRMLDQADAMAELNRDAEAESMDALTKKYASEQTGVDDELAALKAKLGK